MIYNTGNNRYFTFGIDKYITTIYKELSEPDNLYSVKIDGSDLEKEHIREWIDNIISIGAGDLTANTGPDSRPASLPPILKLLEGVDDIQEMHSRQQAGKIISYLHEVTLHINGDNSVHPDYHKQLLSPMRSEDDLSVGKVAEFINNCKGSENLGMVNLAGDIFSHPEFADFRQWIQQESTLPVTVIIGADSFFKNITTVGSMIADDILFTVLTEYPDDTRKITNIGNIKWIIPVRSERDYEKAARISDNYNIEKRPFFTGNNLDFFRRCVFVEEDDLRNAKLTKRDIFARQTLNSNFFGRLVVLPDGTVHANVNHPALGRIEDPLYDILYKEIITGTSWRMLRDRMPCRDCIYRWMCPPISNYELVLQKPDLCNLS
ncbi:MAG: TIGR04150 pseudo-rSAM protein [Alistipes sp.]|nr:TIGR04150 pseudo-rSAM protein [Alistipes sp.]